MSLAANHYNTEEVSDVQRSHSQIAYLPDAQPHRKSFRNQSRLKYDNYPIQLETGSFNDIDGDRLFDSGILDSISNTIIVTTKSAEAALSVSDMVEVIKEVLGLSVVQIARITGISRPAVYKHINGDTPSDTSDYHDLYNIAVTVRDDYRSTIKPGLKSILIGGKTLLEHFYDSYMDTNHIIGVSKQIAEKLKNHGEPKPKPRSISEQRRAVMSIGKSG